MNSKKSEFLERSKEKKRRRSTSTFILLINTKQPLVLINRAPVVGEYYLRSFWYGPSEARSIQERLRAIFSQLGPELVRVKGAV